MANILIIYGNYNYPLRATIDDHLYSFQRYSGHNCFYLNLAVRRVPMYLFSLHFDVVIFHTTFLSKRWINFNSFLKKARPLKKLNTVKVALPQDEFIKTDMLCDFINEFEIDYVFSVAPESEWSKIYHKVDFRKVKFFRVLTGYLDDKTLLRIKKLEEAIFDRPIDIGYRAYGVRHWLGRHGFLKIKIANIFKDVANKYDLDYDISIDGKDTFYGDEWYKFLLQCKYTIGVEGGATILDRDGSIRDKTEHYLVLHPDATYDEVEAACFPNMDGNLNLIAISPRHLEACATKTCQILIEGQYNDILKPGVHFIELKRDFSNIDKILSIIKDDKIRGELTKQAYKDIVESGLFTYRSFVKQILDKTLEKKQATVDIFKYPLTKRLIIRWLHVTDIFSWIFALFFSTALKFAKAVFPKTYNKLFRKIFIEK